MIRLTQKLRQLRRPQGPASWTALAIAALIALEAAHLWSALAVLTRHDPATGSAPSLRATGPRNPGVDVARIASAHLFGTSAKAPTKFAAAVATSNSTLLLTGTLARRNPQRGVAIISESGKSSLYAVGARVGDATVAAVFRDHVILNRNGTLESLLLPRQPMLSGHGSEPTLVASAASYEGGGNPGDPHALADVIRAGGSVNDPSGHMRGFRIFPGRDRTAFGAAGLRGGDLVVAVNGTSVLDQNRDSSQEVFKNIAAAERATVTIERNGRTSDITVDVAQAGLLSNSAVPAAPSAEN